MSIIRILDCTLRDGGYCNQWNFGEENTKKIINGLVEAGIDIIECGFLTNKTIYRKDITKYTTMQEASAMLPKERGGKQFVCMVNYGEYNLDDIPPYDGTSLDGLRVAFHKKDMLDALAFCKGIKEKGYKVFIQAMVSLNYNDKEFLELIQKINEFSPYAFYIVDSFGVMKRKDLIRLFYMVENNLGEKIIIGYHSHNNMQLAYSNAQVLVESCTSREIIIDASIYGMGRGAGNLNTELFVEYLNDNIGKQYRLKPLLTIIDEILNTFYQLNYWGYSLPNYLSAKYNVHPNYASYLDNKKTLTVEDINEIFAAMDDFKRSSYDKEYIEELYRKHMAKGYIQEAHLSELQELIYEKEVLIIAPGHSLIEEKNKIIECAKRENIVIISINFNYCECETDFIFLSNLRRFRELDLMNRKKCIVTSNIPAVDVYLQTKYEDLLNDQESVFDNAGMMLVKFLILLKAKKVLIAGLDGYSFEQEINYLDKKMNVMHQRLLCREMNLGMSKVLKRYSRQIAIEFVTTPRYVYYESSTAE